jgi:hypothetical protein
MKGLYNYIQVQTENNSSHVLKDLFEAISQALLNSVDRDAVSGWGAVVHIM